MEEINRVDIGNAGLNYGWRCYEGSQPFNTENCPPQSELTFPIAEYTHANGNCSITGGFVYRGSKYSDIAGFYFFADYCSGLIGTVDSAGNIMEHGNFSARWVSFGEDINKELYIIDINGGDIYKVKGGQIVRIEDFSIENSLRMHPNPASGNVVFSLKDENLQNIQIFDIRGSLVFSEENISSNEKTISIEILNSGIYFTKVTSEKGQTAVKKLIVQ